MGNCITNRKLNEIDHEGNIFIGCRSPKVVRGDCTVFLSQNFCPSWRGRFLVDWSCEAIGIGQMNSLVLAILFLLAFIAIVKGDGKSVHYQHWNMTSEQRRLLSADHWRALKEYTTPERLSWALGNNTHYKNKKPFPHAFYDGLFPESVLRAAIREIPDSPQLDKGCAKHNDKCFNGKDQKGKNAFENDLYHGPATSALFGFMKSSLFIRFLERLTGIDDIIPDPHFRGSGIHQTLPGGFLSIHADFNRYQQYDMHRRVNAFIFLNPDWDDSYGGHLELWSKDMKKCEARIRPDLGRFVAFSSTDFSYHGHPNPLKCPPDRSRRSLALYYYTRSRPSSECVHGNCNYAHSTLFQKRQCPDCELEKCQKFA